MKIKKIAFNVPYLTGKEVEYIHQAVSSGKISGNGIFTQKCQTEFEIRYGFKKTLLTSSCTDALEMSALLLDIQPGDEVIIPSYTFVSTANAFVLRGAKIVFADSRRDHPGMDEDSIEALVTPRTKAIVPVHYGGVACDMDKITALAAKNNLVIVEDAAQAIDSYFTGKSGLKKALGSIGDLATFSFHETKNIISGEGGMFVANAPRFIQRSEIIWEKGTNRAAFWRGEVDRYGWVDVGSSFLPSELVAAFLFAQVENIDIIQNKRKSLWKLYFDALTPLADMGRIKLPVIPPYATNNAQMFYILCGNPAERTELIAFAKERNIWPVFHYLSLHKSPFYHAKHDGRELPRSDFYSDCLLRLPMFYELSASDVEIVVGMINNFYLR